MRATTLLIGTRNEHKAQEMRSILGDNYLIRTLNDFPNAPSVKEDANTFAGNATKKAIEFARWLASSSQDESLLTKGYVLADDSGLEVDALNGAPGVRSARFAASDKEHGNSSDAANNAKLLQLLNDIPLARRTARFRCVLALTPILPAAEESASPVCYADETELQTIIFAGTCEGRIGLLPKGVNGFGYDPLFIPDGYEESFAELGEQTKNTLSHRAKAVARLREALLKKPLAPDKTEKR